MFIGVETEALLCTIGRKTLFKSFLSLNIGKKE